jgi:hypothetical protein
MMKDKLYCAIFLMIISLVSCSNNLNVPLSNELPSTLPTTNDQPSISTSIPTESPTPLESSETKPTDTRDSVSWALIELSDTVHFVGPSLLLDYEIIDNWVLFPEKEYLSYEDFFSEERLIWAPHNTIDYIDDMGKRHRINPWNVYDDSHDSSIVAAFPWDLYSEYHEIASYFPRSQSYGHTLIVVPYSGQYIVAIDGKNRTISLILEVGPAYQSHYFTDELLFVVAGNTLFRYHIPSKTLDILCCVESSINKQIIAPTNYISGWVVYNEAYLSLIREHGIGTQELKYALFEMELTDYHSEHSIYQFIYYDSNSQEMVLLSDVPPPSPPLLYRDEVPLKTWVVPPYKIH